MIKEALEYFASLVNAGNKPKLLLDEPQQDTYLVKDQEFVVKKVFPNRSHTISSIDDFCVAANRFAVQDVVSVWYSPSSVVGVIDDTRHRLNRITFTPTFSQAWLAVLELAKLTPRNQVDFIRFLRINLAGTMDAKVLIDPCRNLNFRSSRDETGTVGQSKNTMGREIRSEAIALIDIPETVTLSVPVYACHDLDIRFQIRCTVDINTESSTLTLIPFPDEVNRTMWSAMDMMRNALLKRLNLSSGKPLINMHLYQGCP